MLTTKEKRYFLYNKFNLYYPENHRQQFEDYNPKIRISVELDMLDNDVDAVYDFYMTGSYDKTKEYSPNLYVGLSRVCYMKQKYDKMKQYLMIGVKENNWDSIADFKYYYYNNEFDNDINTYLELEYLEPLSGYIKINYNNIIIDDKTYELLHKIPNRHLPKTLVLIKKLHDDYEQLLSIIK